MNFPLPVRAEKIKTPPAWEKWALRGLLVLAILALVGTVAVAGWVVFVGTQRETADWASNHWRERLEPNFGLIVGGCVLGGAIGVGSYWGYRRVKRRLVAESKNAILRHVLSGDITEKKAAKELGVDRAEIRDAVKELEEEGAVE